MTFAPSTWIRETAAAVTTTGVGTGEVHSTEAWRETCSLDLDPRDCGRITTTGVGTVVVRTSKEHGESIKKGHLKSTHFTRENSNNVKDLDELEPSLRGWASTT